MATTLIPIAVSEVAASNRPMGPQAASGSFGKLVAKKAAAVHAQHQPAHPAKTSRDAHTTTSAHKTAQANPKPYSRQGDGPGPKKRAHHSQSRDAAFVPSAPLMAASPAHPAPRTAPARVRPVMAPLKKLVHVPAKTPAQSPQVAVHGKTALAARTAFRTTVTGSATAKLSTHAPAVPAKTGDVFQAAPHAKAPSPEPALAANAKTAAVASRPATTHGVDIKTTHTHEGTSRASSASASSGSSAHPNTAPTVPEASPVTAAVHHTAAPARHATVSPPAAATTAKHATGEQKLLPGWKIQETQSIQQDGTKRSSWTIHPPAAQAPPMKMEITQQGSKLRADLTVSPAAMGLINATPTALPHHAVHLPEGVSTLQFSLLTQGGSEGYSGGGYPPGGSPSNGHGEGGGGYEPMPAYAALETLNGGWTTDGVDYRA